jgi:hypothetical protein
MSMGGLGTLAAVRHAMDQWRPAESETVDDRRTTLEGHLRKKLDSARQVETHRTTALPDVVVDGTVGVLFAEEVSGRTVDRIEERLDRFDGQYPLLFVVGDVRDPSVWERLEKAYTDSGPTAGQTEFVFESLASLRAPDRDWGDWKESDEPWHDLRSAWVYPALAAGLLLADELLRSATRYDSFLPDEPMWRLFFLGLVLVWVLGEDLVRPWLHG